MKTLRFNPEYSYCVDLRAITLVHQKGTRLTLDYPQAAIFDMLIKEYPMPDKVRMLQHIALLTEVHARRLMDDTIDELVHNQVFLWE